MLLRPEAQAKSNQKETYPKWLNPIIFYFPLKTKKRKNQGCCDQKTPIAINSAEHCHLKIASIVKVRTFLNHLRPLLLSSLAFSKRRHHEIFFLLIGNPSVKRRTPAPTSKPHSTTSSFTSPRNCDRIPSAFTDLTTVATFPSWTFTCT